MSLGFSACCDIGDNVDDGDKRNKVLSDDVWKQQIENIHPTSSSKHDLSGSFGDLPRPTSLKRRHSLSMLQRLASENLRKLDHFALDFRSCRKLNRNFQKKFKKNVDFLAHAGVWAPLFCELEQGSQLPLTLEWCEANSDTELSRVTTLRCEFMEPKFRGCAQSDIHELGRGVGALKDTIE